jgi:peptidoglycan-associated lipoprotein
MRVPKPNSAPAFCLLFLLTASSAAPLLAQTQAQAKSTAALQPQSIELAFGYTYLHSNMPPAGCGCFPLSGGSMQLAIPLPRPGFFVAADYTIVSQNNAIKPGNSLTIGALSLGAQYRPPHLRSPLQPFGQLLVGGAQASGSVVAPPNPGAGNASLAFAGTAGGGLDLRVGDRVSVRLAQADYLLTTFDNGSNNHQNNFRLTAGIVIHLAP